MEKETIIIDEVRYYSDRPEAADAAISGRTGRLAAPLRRRTAITWRSLRR